MSKVKELIINTASELFYKKGFNLVGINEIVSTAGIAKASLYNHFKTKNDLLLAYLDKMDRDLMTSLMEFVNNKPIGDERLISVLEFLYPFFNKENFNGCWCIRSLAEVPMDNESIRDKVKSNKARLLSFCKMLVVENKPDLSSEEQLSLAHHLYLLYEGAITESHVHGESWPIDEAISLLQRRLKC